MMHLIPIFVKFTKIHNVPINEVYSGHFLKSLAWCMVDVPPQKQNEDIMLSLMLCVLSCIRRYHVVSDAVYFKLYAKISCCL